MLIGSSVERVDIPHEPGEWVEVRKLSYKTLARAAFLRSDANIQNMKAMGGDLLEAMRSARERAGQDAPSATTTEPVNPDAYDMDLVLIAGTLRWSYGVPVTTDTIADLDDRTAQWLQRTILQRSVAPIDPVTVGNVTPPSTGS